MAAAEKKWMEGLEKRRREEVLQLPRNSRGNVPSASAESQIPSHSDSDQPSHDHPPIDDLSNPKDESPEPHTINSTLAGSHTSRSTMNTETTSPVSPESASSVQPQLTRRQRLLELARENARTPLPTEIVDPEAQTDSLRRKSEEKAKQEEEREKTMSSVRERLLKLMGGKWL